MIIVVSYSGIYAQNDSIYLWKEGQLLAKHSIKAADLDSITFKRPINPNGINIKGPNVTDIDGNVYASVSNCGQTWTQRNLNVSKYSDGTPIPQVTDPIVWQKLTTGAWCYYNNDPASEVVYGKLYNWYAVAGIYNSASNTNPALRKKLVPTGWHVPSDSEWTQLTDCLGGGEVAGGKMKKTDWGVGATNSSGFTALPGGYRYSNGTFYYGGAFGWWWSTTDFDDISSNWGRLLDSSSDDALRTACTKPYGISVRCIKD